MGYPQWLYSTGTCTPYESGVSSAFAPSVQSGMVAIPLGMSGLLPAEARDVTESQDLASAFQSITIEDFVDGSAFSREEFYLESYWTWVHDLFPVIHRPTLHLPTASPLLRAAILALGAQALGGRDHLSNARNLHERSMKIVTKVPSTQLILALAETDQHAAYCASRTLLSSLRHAGHSIDRGVFTLQVKTTSIATVQELRAVVQTREQFVRSRNRVKEIC